MLSLLKQSGNSVVPILKSAGVDTNALRQQVEKALEGLAQVHGVGGEVQLSGNYWQSTEFM